VNCAVNLTVTVWFVGCIVTSGGLRTVIVAVLESAVPVALETCTQ
jgi:hypothetical protein